MRKLSTLFATALSKKYPNNGEELNTLSILNANTKETQMGSSFNKTSSSTTILQLNAKPFAIDVNEYSNAHGPDNPTGDYQASYRFTLLAGPIPQLQTYYMDSPYLIDQVWGNIVRFGNSTVAYTQHLLTEAHEKMTTSKMSGMGGIPDDWYPVYAKPSNWYEIIENEENLIEIEIDLHNGDYENNDFTTIEGNEELSLTVTGPDKKSKKIDIQTETVIKKIILKVICVDFIRPWINFEILNLQNWTVEGLEKHYYSNGKLKNNKGIFPLLKKSMLIGTKVTVEGDFEKKDLKTISEQDIANNIISLGPFLLSTKNESIKMVETEQSTLLSSSVHQIIGYFSEQVPKSPYLSAKSL
ncbi:hypothetical protein [Xanthovirga aplysinae]|uniref:hypothetical protein n=1 Tax=Xanthovirga aplysinae TaxID=2529853 RepID=UPI0012BCD2C0|nr:hypothetical protein [Xanthovirga aplysinae]MTI33589.1 hypothetical protein [Xanthovirga aplysinae]